ncbi:MAG: hypothetical protein JXQ72_04675 [Anaerolineae bacterium]|nr:hypothetical protein [Anaerolineae bacterium]
MVDRQRAKTRITAAAAVILITILAVILARARDSRAAPDVQGNQISPTPIQLQFPTATETPGPPTETPTRTPTSIGRPYAEALSDGTNVRANPDINANRVAQIYPGTLYPVLGRNFQWYMIEFPNTPNGIVWVHESVVTISGDETQIAEINLADVPTLDPLFANAQETAAVITQTPGAIASLTARVQITPTGLFTANPGATFTLAPGQRLPTFTFPAYTPTPLVIPRTMPVSATTDSSGVPPIIPILVLGSLGLMGLLVAFLRRL